MTAPPKARPARIDHLPRVSLGEWPTALHRLDGLSRELGLELWAKRDDLTTLALGGNKVRKLEFLLGDAVGKGSDVVVSTGGSQSNHARLTAAACAILGLECRLILDRGRHPDGGNLLLDDLFGAKVTIIEDSNPDLAAAAMEQLANDLRSQGRDPYVIPRGGSVPQGATGYVSMVLELTGQLDGMVPDAVYVATGSGGTHSGVMAGRSLAGHDWRVQGISVSRARSLQEAKILELSNQTLAWIGNDSRILAEHVHVDDGFAGPAYGVPTLDTWNAIQLAARLDGLVLDPVYTGKAMAGLIAHARQGRIRGGASVVFVHTGGSPALFAYAGEAPWAISR